VKWAGFSPPAIHLTISFTLRGFDGQVFVQYEENTDPQSWGFELLNLPFDLELINGFPVCEAKLEYAGSGYYATMGWIQLVTVKETLSGETWTAVDQMPNQHGLELPFSFFGDRPTMFDAPGPNPPRSDETWLAETFLAVCPDVARTRTIEAAAGFSWGYRLEQMRPTLLPVEICASDRWNYHLPYLKETFPSWTFLASAYGDS